MRCLELDEKAFAAYYHRVATQTLWFLHHHLFDLARSPRFGPEFRSDWLAYERVNAVFAAACADEVALGGTVLLQDYHLAAAPALLRRAPTRRAHRSRTPCPWADPGYFATLPVWVARRLIDGMLEAGLTVLFCSPLGELLSAQLRGPRVRGRMVVLLRGGEQRPRHARPGVHGRRRHR